MVTANYPTFKTKYNYTTRHIDLPQMSDDNEVEVMITILPKHDDEVEYFASMKDMVADLQQYKNPY